MRSISLTFGQIETRRPMIPEVLIRFLQMTQSILNVVASI